MSFHPVRCDRCRLMHKKCDRALPACKRCTINEIECTYLYDHRIRRPLEKIEDRITVIKLINTGMTKQHRNEPKKALCNKNKTGPKIERCFINSYYFDTPVKFMSSFPRMDIMENLMTLLQYPSLFKASNGLILLLKLGKILLSSINNRKAIVQNKNVERPKVLSLFTVLNQSISNFFNYNNRIFPLFVKKNFDFISKPLPLRLAIFASGLVWMEQTEEIVSLFSYLGDKLIDHLKEIPRLSPSIEILQTLLIVIIWLRAFPKVELLFYNFLAFCDRITGILGLHRSPKILTKKKIQERAMTYSCYIMLSINVTLASGSYLCWPFKSSWISSNYIKLQKNTKAIINNNEKRTVVEADVLLCCFYSDISVLLVSLRLLKGRFVFGNTSVQSLNKLTNYLLDNIEKVKMEYIMLYKVNHINNSDLINFKNYILFICEYLSFFVHTLHLYSPAYNTNPNLLNSNYENLETISKALVHCKSVVKYGSRLPYHFTILFGIPFISQCVIFILRYRSKSGLDYQNSIDNGRGYIDKAKVIPSLKAASIGNIALINIIANL